MGLEGLLESRTEALTGILNGIDETVWDPASDPNLAQRFTAKSLSRRKANKRRLQQRFGLPAEEAMLLGVISRLSWEKGLDLLLEALPTVLETGAQLVVLGSGDADLQRGFREAAGSHPDRVGVIFGYDEGLAHLVQGGSDALIVPSRFEPCGLTQLCAMRYGSIPIVSRVGGLNDTVIDANPMALAAGVATGFQFARLSREGLAGAVRLASTVWQDQRAWRRMQGNGMAGDLGWAIRAETYMQVFRSAAFEQGNRAAGGHRGGSRGGGQRRPVAETPRTWARRSSPAVLS